MLRFGTDGVRGVANAELTPEYALALGRAAARVLGVARPFVVARDTRRSGPMLESALAAGLTAEGARVLLAGVLPTPGAAYLGRLHRGPAAVISASHNAWRDNGIKFFAAGGRKLGDPEQEQIEASLVEILTAGPSAAAGTPDAGSVTPVAGPVESYADTLVQITEGRRLDGLSVVVDCANGAASAVAPLVLSRLGAKVEVHHAEPDGTNINDGCGSTHPAELQQAVVALGADVGLAFDGDGDRLVAVDEGGALVDGDHFLAIAALDLRSRGRLRHEAVATTVMANLGFRRAMEAEGIRVVETAVGDRSVLAAMEAEGLSLGGEQSGHIIFADLATTGDGLLAGLVLLDIIKRTRRALSDLASVVTKFPQLLVNVRVADRSGLETAETFWAEVRRVEDELGTAGRVLVRPSGTEPVVRLMVEASTTEVAEATVGRLERALRAALG